MTPLPRARPRAHGFRRDEHGMARAVRWTRAMRDIRSPRARLPARATPPATPFRQGPRLELIDHEPPAIDEASYRVLLAESMGTGLPCVQFTTGFDRNQCLIGRMSMSRR